MSSDEVDKLNDSQRFPPPQDEDADRDKASTESSSQLIRYRELLEFALDALLLSDVKGIILEANQSATILFQTPREFLIGKPLGLFIEQGFRSRFYESLAKLTSLTPIDEFETRVARGGVSRDVFVRREAASGEDAYSIRWLFRDITERNHAEQLKADLFRQLLSTQENERRRLSRDLHDQLGQDLVGLTLGLKAMEHILSEPAQALARLRDIELLVERIQQVIHDTAIDLRPTALDDLGLQAAITGLVRRWSRQYEIPVDLHFALGRSSRFASELETTIYRVVQEALTNVAKHALATNASVVIERRDHHLVAIIEDDGHGFDVEMPKKGRLGILGMKERVSLIGGMLQIESSDAGTTIRIRVPLST